MDRDEPMRGGKIYGLDEYRASRSSRESISIERDEGRHGESLDTLAAAMVRHPSRVRATSREGLRAGPVLGVPSAGRQAVALDPWTD
jgi:hypothetical protein